NTAAAEVEKYQRYDHEGVQNGHRHKLSEFDPQDLPDEQILQMLGTMRIVAQQDDFGAGCDDKDYPDHGLLKGGEMALAPNQESGGNQGRDNSADLTQPAVRLPSHRVGRDNS